MTRHSLGVQWLVATDPDFVAQTERAIRAKAPAILRAAAFVSAENKEGHDAEARVWAGAVCVSVTWEPGAASYGFHVLDETLRERLACILFPGVPCVDSEGSAREVEVMLDALRATITPTDGAMRVSFDNVDSGIAR